MATGDFDTYYSDNPWEVIDKNQRTWYDPELIAIFRQSALFTPTIRFVKNLGDVRATKMVMTQLLDPQPDTTALAVRQIWMPAAHIDSRAVEVTFSRYGGKVAYNTYDELVTYWKQNNQEGIRQIMKGALGQHMIDVLDLLARNAYISGALGSGFTMFPSTGTAFDDIATTDTFALSTALDIWLGMSLRGVATALGPSGAAGSIVCYTTPSVIYDIQKGSKSDEWISIHEYADPAALLRYEVGTYKNVRFVQSPKLVLWNCGTLVAQGLITSAINAGDGAPPPGSLKVDGTYMVGQTTGAVKNYVNVGSYYTGGYSDFVVGDMVTIHVTRTAAYGVTNGVDYAEGTAQTRRIVAKSTGPDHFIFDKPIMTDFTTSDAGTYAYMTKARNIHASIFVGGNEGIVSGVAMPPRLHSPAPVDDFDMVQRFSWDGYLGYQTYAPEVFEVVFSAGTTRIKGAAAVQ
jgi:hypothetical protein